MFARALILLLLVVNAGVAAWWAFAPTTVMPTPAPRTTAPRLQLVGEVPARGRAMPIAAPPAVAPVPAAAQCWRFGPFANTAVLAPAQAWLQPRVARSSVVLVPVSGRGWRVWLPPLADHDTAQAMAGQIAAAGFTDYYVVPNGVEANSIALGRYGNEEAARRRQAALQAGGFGAKAEALGASTQWIDVAAASGFNADAARAAIGAAHVLVQDCPQPH